MTHHPLTLQLIHDLLNEAGHFTYYTKIPGTINCDNSPAVAGVNAPVFIITQFDNLIHTTNIALPKSQSYKSTKEYDIHNPTFTPQTIVNEIIHATDQAYDQAGYAKCHTCLTYNPKKSSRITIHLLTDSHTITCQKCNQTNTPSPSDSSPTNSKNSATNTTPAKQYSKKTSSSPRTNEESPAPHTTPEESPSSGAPTTSTTQPSPPHTTQTTTSTTTSATPTSTPNNSSTTSTNGSPTQNAKTQMGNLHQTNKPPPNPPSHSPRTPQTRPPAKSLRPQPHHHRPPPRQHHTQLQLQKRHHLANNNPPTRTHQHQLHNHPRPPRPTHQPLQPHR